jgi:protein TonB
LSKQTSRISKAFQVGGLLAVAGFLGQTAKADVGRFYSEQDVHILQRVAPSYPPIAKQIHLSGTVVVDMNVNEEGSVDNASVVSGNPILGGGAVAAAKHWKFAPVMDDGKPVKATVRIAFKFTD